MQLEHKVVGVACRRRARLEMEMTLERQAGVSVKSTECSTSERPQTDVSIR